MQSMSTVRFALAALTVLAADATFTPKPLEQGKFTISSAGAAKIQMSIKAGGNEIANMEMPSKEDIACVVSISGADAKGPTGAKLAFGKCAKVTPSPLGAQEAAHSCSNQTVEMKRGDSGFAATTELEKEAKDATGWIADSLLTAPLASVLGGKTMKKGDVVDVPADAAHRAIALYASDANVKSMKLTLDGERNEGGVDAAVFKVVMTIVKPPAGEDPTEMTIEMTGDLVVAKSELIVVSATLTGRISLQGSMEQGGQKMEMSGAGTTSWSYSAKVE